MSTTPFVETELLLAVMNNDPDRVQELLSSTTAGERGDLLMYLETLISVIESV